MQLRSRCFLVRMHDAEYRDMAGQTNSRHRQIGLFDVTACQLSVKKAAGSVQLTVQDTSCAWSWDETLGH